MGAWDLGFLDNDNAMDTIGEFGYDLEQGMLKEEALEKAINECRYEEDSIYALAFSDLKENKRKKIHIILKKLTLACIDLDFEEGRYQNYFDEEGRLKQLKKLKKEIEKAESWGKEFEIIDPFCIELLENYVDVKERTSSLELDYFKEHEYFARMYKDKDRRVWNIDFVYEIEDFYGAILVPYTKKRKNELNVSFYLSHEPNKERTDYSIQYAPEWFQKLYKIAKKKYAQYNH